jgi:hypothetical protein
MAIHEQLHPSRWPRLQYRRRSHVTHLSLSLNSPPLPIDNRAGSRAALKPLARNLNFLREPRSGHALPIPILLR